MVNGGVLRECAVGSKRQWAARVNCHRNFVIPGLAQPEPGITFFWPIAYRLLEAVWWLSPCCRGQPTVRTESDSGFSLREPRNDGGVENSRCPSIADSIFKYTIEFSLTLANWTASGYIGGIETNDGEQLDPPIDTRALIAPGRPALVARCLGRGGLCLGIAAPGAGQPRER